jgi:Tfp pilus assembly protein PilV
MIEALIASALLAVGLAGAARLASSTLLAGHESRHQHLALGMAQDILECWGVPSAHCQSWFPTLLTAADGSSSLDAQGMRFARSWRISTLWPSPYSFEALPGLQELSVRVQWRP